MAPMNEAITKALHDAQFLTADLQTALHHARATEAIVLMPLIAQAAQIGDALKALQSAVAEDEEGRAPISKGT